MEFDPSASISVVDKGTPSVTPSDLVIAAYGYITGSECGADSCT